MHTVVRWWKTAWIDFQENNDENVIDHPFYSSAHCVFNRGHKRSPEVQNDWNISKRPKDAKRDQIFYKGAKTWRFWYVFCPVWMRHNFYLPFPWLQWTWRSVLAKSDSLGFLVKAQARKSNRLAWKWPLETLGKTIFVRAKGPLSVPTLIRLC